jgi:hypothetical protein
MTSFFGLQERVMTRGEFRRFVAVISAVGFSALVPSSLRGGTIGVPGGSFESPQTPYVSINIDSWQKTAKPDYYDESGGFLWTQLTGAFKNTPVGSSDHIDNCDGDQAIWLFAVPEVGLFQDYDSVDWKDTSPTHGFDVRFETGKSYRLTVGVIGGGGNMPEGSSLEISLYYRDASSTRVTVAASSVVNSPTMFPTMTQLVDFSVEVPTVKADDAWAGQHLGMQMVSTVGTNLQGGYWDLDNVRLTSLAAPVLLEPVWTSNQFRVTATGEPGLQLEFLAATDAAPAPSDWATVDTVVNITGTASFVDTNLVSAGRFYQVRQFP